MMAIDRFLEGGIKHDTWRVQKSDKDRFAPEQLGIVRVGVDTRPAKARKGAPRLVPGIYALCEVESEWFKGTEVADLCGVTAIYPHDPVALDIFSALGTVVKARGASDFDLFGAACCTMGTFFGILESTARWMESRGMKYGTARAFLPALFGGLSQVARLSPSKSLEQLRSEFSTSGGLNEKVFDIFRSHGGPQALTDGLDAAIARLTARS